MAVIGIELLDRIVHRCSSCDAIGIPRSCRCDPAHVRDMRTVFLITTMKHPVQPIGQWRVTTHQRVICEVEIPRANRPRQS